MGTKTSVDDKHNNKNVTRSAFKATIGSVFSLLLGFVSSVLIASLIGTGTEMDAYLTAFVIPTYIQAVLLTGLAFVLIPQFIRETVEGRTEDAWGMVGTFFWLTIGILTGITLIGLIFASEILGTTAPGLGGAKADLTEQMLQILLVSMPLLGVATLCEGVQNARGRFFWPGLAPALGALVNIIVLVALYQRISALALAWGFVASTAVRACVTAIPVLRHGWRSKMPLTDPRFLEMGKLIAPFIFFGFITRSIPVVERYFASNLPDGDLSYLGYGSKIGKWIMAVLGQGISIAIFPAMSQAFVKRGDKGLIEQSEFGIRFTFASVLPTLAILSAVSVPLITFLFERGAFDHSATLSIVRILPVAIVAEVLLVMTGNVIGRTYYVKKDTVTGSLVFVLTFVFYLFFARWLIGKWGYVGLAIAPVIHSGLVLLFLMFILTRRMDGFHSRSVLKDVLVFGAISSLVYFISRILLQLFSIAPLLAQLVIPSSIAALVYLGLLYLFNREMALSILEVFGLRQAAGQVKASFRQIWGTTRGV